MEPTPPKLSLVAQFDDLFRQLVGYPESEEVFLDFVQNQQECCQRWHSTDLENAQLRKQVTVLTESNTELARKLAHTKDVLEKEVLRRETCELEVISKKHQLEQIREFMINSTDHREDTLTFLKEVEDRHAKKLQTIEESIGSVLSPSDASDEEDSHRSSRGKRRSSKIHLVEETSPQRKRARYKGGQEEDEGRGCATSVVATTTVTVANGKDLVAASQVHAEPHTLPCTSAPPKPPRTPAQTPAQTPAATPSEAPAHLPKSGSGSAPNTPVCQRRSFSPSPSDFTPVTQLRRTNSAGKLMSKEHAFVTKTMMKTETCGPCGKKINFYRSALKCVCCRSVCHHDCRDKVPVPCVPVSQTPQQGRAARRGTISDYAPSSSPMVPALVVHCIQEVERRGLTEVGLYRVPGGAKEVHDLRVLFQRGKGVPNLSQVDIHVVCSVLKDFLRSLTETLITKSLWNVFATAAELLSGDRTCGLWQAVSDLPPANRDTLAALVLHLLVVASSPQVKMPIENLVQVFAPTVVGYSTARVASVGDLHGETRTQAQVMHALLDLPSDYWSQILNSDSDVNSTGRAELKKTPGRRGEVLGPIFSSGGAGSSSLAKTISRAVPKSVAPRSKKSFFSPTLV